MEYNNDCSHLARSVKVKNDEDLIAQYIERNPNKPGLDEARLKNYHVSVWAIIGYLNLAVEGNVEHAAKDYGLPHEAVEAALAYYRRHRCRIDVRIAANNPDFDSILDAA